RLIFEMQREMDKLTLRAPKQGTAISPPKERELGTTLKSGELFCQGGNPNQLEAYIVIEHSDRSLIDPIDEEHAVAIETSDDAKNIKEIRGQRVWLKISGHVGEILEGSVARISNTEIE